MIGRRPVDTHGGETEARSGGSGPDSVFTVAPLRAGAASAVDSTRPNANGADRRRRILIVEDQRDAAEMLALLLEAQSHSVLIVADGHAALVEAGPFKPDIILIDIGLPGMSGHDLADRLRRNPIQPRPLLIAVTGHGHDEDRARSLRAGFDHHLVKPIDFDMLAALFQEPELQR